MSWNPVTWVRDYFDRRREQENARKARQGLTTSGHLSEGERQGMFRKRDKSR